MVRPLLYVNRGYVAPTRPLCSGAHRPSRWRPTGGTLELLVTKDPVKSSWNTGHLAIY
jgi:hypothetical protein